MMNGAATKLSEPEKLLVEQCAMQLKVIQSDAAALAAPNRQEYLADAINRALKECNQADRERLLQGLLEKFPVAGRLVERGARRFEEPALREDTVDTLLDKIIKSWGSVPAERHAEIIK